MLIIAPCRINGPRTFTVLARERYTIRLTKMQYPDVVGLVRRSPDLSTPQDNLGCPFGDRDEGVPALGPPEVRFVSKRRLFV
jgi:hypothetical protein